MKKIAVIGGGVMGLDIGQVFATKGYDVVVRDVKKEIIDASQARLHKTLDKLVAKGKIDETKKNDICKSITFTTDLSNVKDADLLIEAASENFEVKKMIFSELDDVCESKTIFATNTSSVSITALASFVKRSDRFIGMHFFNPATIMKLVEIIEGEYTSKDTVDAIRGLVEKIDKTPVKVSEAPGFVVNRILVPMINEAIGLVETNVASVEDIDAAMMFGANHPMGPLALADLIGLDVCLAIMDVIHEETRDSKYRASLLMRKMVRAGLLGRKSGKGFYDYSK